MNWQAKRKHLLLQSISITLHHPLFGIGIGNYAPYVAQTNKDAGSKKEAYLGTHNSYTQMSSEAGLPGILIFLAIIVTSWRSLTRLIRATRDDPRPAVKDIYAAAQATQACLGAFCFSLLFIHIAFDILPHMLCGIAFMVSSTGQRQLHLLGAEESPPAPSEVAQVRRDYRPQIAPAMRA